MGEPSKALRSNVSRTVSPVTTGRRTAAFTTTVSPHKVVEEQKDIEVRLEDWFRSIVQSNHDLATALERLRDTYRKLLAENPVSASYHAVLIGVEATLRDAENVRELN
jgi:hypothetical protein